MSDMTLNDADIATALLLQQAINEALTRALGIGRHQAAELQAAVPRLCAQWVSNPQGNPREHIAELAGRLGIGKQGAAVLDVFVLSILAGLHMGKQLRKPDAPEEPQP